MRIIYWVVCAFVALQVATSTTGGDADFLLTLAVVLVIQYAVYRTFWRLT